MGNFSSKEHHGDTGHPDIFHTPPTSPSADAPTAVQLQHASLTPPPLAAPLSCPAPVPAKPPPEPRPGEKPQSDSAPTAPSPPPDWKPPIPPSGATSVVIGGSGDGLPTSPQVQSASPECHWGPASASTPVPGAQGDKHRGGASSPNTTLAVLDPPTSSHVDGRPGRGLSERDSGLCLSVSREEMEAVVEQCVTTLGLPQDGARSTAELLKCLLTEINSLRNNLQTERNEWLQFQTDLQVAVAVADRLRAEAEEELLALRGAHKELEKELAASQRRGREAESRGGKLTTTLQEVGKAQAKAPAEARHTSGPGSLGGANEGRRTALRGRGRASPENGSATAAAKGEETKTDAGGVARRYMKNLTSEGGRSRTNETRVTGTTERSRSLSRIALSLDSHLAHNGHAESNAVTTTSCAQKNSHQPKGQSSPDRSSLDRSRSSLDRSQSSLDRSRSSLDRSQSSLDRSQSSLDRPDSCTAHAGKREELLNKYNSALSELPPTKSQDGFNMLLRRHGGSKRNSLLRWCQNRTVGYKNIDLTNFSSSWVDGLAFCAVYHTYLPSHVPYSTLRPENKRENLNLAFKTGENVGMTCSLTVEEMLRPGGPDWQRVLSYVESMYRHFEM